MNWQPGTVLELIEQTARTKSIVFDVPGWSRHRAGQHVDVRLTAEDGYQAQRSYSIASAPEDRHIELTVERIEDGEVSPFLADELLPGDEIELRGPIGAHFSWRVEDGGPLLLIGGGSGLVPLMSMLRHRAARGSDVDTRLLVSARTFADLLYRDELAEGPGLAIHRTLTRERPDGWDGFGRRVDREMLEAVGPPPDARPRVFVCGPTGFVEQVADALVELGHAPGAVHAERFGPTGG